MKTYSMIGRLALLCSAILIVICSAGGCASRQYMRYYFASVDADKDNPAIKYYRVTVKGSGINVNSELLTGWYDAEALHQLFGKVEPKSTAATKTNLMSYSLEYDDVAGQWHLKPCDSRFTVLYGADAKAMAAQVQMFADSDLAGQNMAQLLAAAVTGSNYEEAIKIKRQSQALGKEAVSLAKVLRNSAAMLRDDTKTSTPAQVRGQLFDATQKALWALGSSTTLNAAHADQKTQQAEAAYRILQEIQAKKEENR